MERVIDRRLGSRQSVPALYRIEHRLVKILQDEIEHRCRSAARRGSRSGKVSVSRYCSAERHREVSVRVDRSREHQLVLRVDDLRAVRRLDAFRYSGYLSVRHGDIRPVHSAGGYKRSVLYEKIHILPSFREASDKRQASARRHEFTCLSCIRARVPISDISAPPRQDPCRRRSP